MPVRTISNSPCQWTDAFAKGLGHQYELLGLTRPPLVSQVDGPRSAPELLMYFGAQQWAPNPPLEAELDNYARNTTTLLPVIDDATDAVTHLPEAIRRFNAFQRSQHGDRWVDALVDETLTLTWQRRRSRRVFISYRRTDAERIAQQLFERYTERSFDVFLDDVSIHRGDDFQVELRRRLDDADAVLLLISPRIAESRWVREEIELALTRRIGLLGVVWPEESFDARPDAIIEEVPADLRIQLDASALSNGSGEPRTQRIDPARLTRIDHLLFTGRSQAIASRLRDLVEVAREAMETDFEIETASPEGDMEARHRATKRRWLARIVPFRPELADLWQWWKRATPPREGLVVVYPELDPTDPRAAALREVCDVWGTVASPRIRLCTVQV